MKTSIPLLCVLLSLSNCNSNTSEDILKKFPKPQLLTQKLDLPIEKDSLGRVEGLLCDENNLIVYDFYGGNSYTLFDINTGEYLTRFGVIGQGAGEIPIGCKGYLSNGNFVIFNDQIKQVFQYNLDSLRKGGSSLFPTRIAKYQISDTQISRLIALNENLFVAAGNHKEGSQYILFDRNSYVKDAQVKTYNADDERFNMYTRFLSNQGDLVKHPHENLLAYSLNFSSNVDFFKVVNNQIVPIKSLRYKNPAYKPIVESEVLYKAVPTQEAITGYIQLCSTSQYVYALYSGKKLYENWMKSKDILVFDWEGTPVIRYSLDKEAYYIAVNENQQKLYVATKDELGSWEIICYLME